MSGGDTERKVGAAAARLTLAAMTRARRVGDLAEVAVEQQVLRNLLEHPRNRPGASMVRHLAMSFGTSPIPSPDPDAVEARLRARLSEAVERVQRSVARDELALDEAVASMLD